MKPYLISIFLLTALAGCAGPKFRADMPVSPTTMDQARSQLQREISFKRANYEQAQRMAARGDCSAIRPYEPFIVSTSAFFSEKLIPDELRAARAQLGVDHQLRVVWADPLVTPNLKVGDIVVALNGRDIDPEKEDGVLVPLRKARYDLAPGEPLQVELAGGAKVEIRGPAGCENGNAGGDIDHAPHRTGFNLTPAFKLPGNLFRQAKTDADLYWLASFALYVTSSPEGEGRKSRAQLASGAQIAAGIGLSIIPGVTSVVGHAVNSTIQYTGLDGIAPAAAEFATREVHARGMDPRPGIEMFARAKGQKLSLDRIEMSEQEIVRIRSLAQELVASNGKEPGQH